MSMANSLSPGIVAREWDLTLMVPQIATAGAAYVGAFQWGPVNKVKLVSSEENLVNIFGTPDSDTFLHWFSAKNFLDYSRNLKLVRVIEATALNATSTGTGVQIINEAEWVDQHSAGTNNVGEFAGRYPGEMGNSIKIEMADGKSFGAVTSVTITDVGSGYTTAADDGATVTFSAPSGTGVTATGTLNVVNDVVTGIEITENGSGYRVAPTVTIPPPAGGGTAATATANLWAYRNQFLTNPGTSAEAAAMGGANDEMHIVVIDADGKITGEAGNVLERFSFVSKASDIKYSDGTTAYYVSVLRDRSKYVYWMDHLESDWGQPASNITFTQMDTPHSVTLSGGTDGNDVTNDELMPGWDMFKNVETIDIGILISGAADNVLKEYLIQNIAEHRKDCVACISPNLDDVVHNNTNEVSDVLALRNVLTSSSYGFFDCNWKYMFDRYNNTFRWVPCNSDTAGLIAYTDEIRDAWWSPAGYNRGHLKNVVKLAWNPDKTDRDELYQNGVNPIVTVAGEGTILLGDKTMLTKPSAFDRINVRRLFITLRKAITKASRYALFEFNDAFTRLRFIQIVEPYLRDVQGRRGIIDFRVICDETNNTGYVIDSNGFVGDIYVKPARSINWITLNFVATPTGVEFDEIIGTFGDF